MMWCYAPARFTFRVWRLAFNVLRLKVGAPSSWFFVVLCGQESSKVFGVQGSLRIVLLISKVYLIISYIYRFKIASNTHFKG